jgi:hypothetical protein
MRAVSRRFAALIPHANQWVSEVDWSNDGFTTYDTASLVSGTATASSLSQTRWACDLTLIDVTPGLDGINAYNTQFLAAWVVPLQAALTAFIADPEPAFQLVPVRDAGQDEHPAAISSWPWWAAGRDIHLPARIPSHLRAEGAPRCR